MLLDNNPDIDVARLERQAMICAARRRELQQPLPAMARNAMASASPTWRDAVRGWPVAGPVLTYFHRGWRNVRAPGLSWRQRVRRAPLVGAALAWLYALATLPRWRRELITQSTQLQHEVASLRRAQGELLRDLAALRAASRPERVGDKPLR